VKRPNLFSKIVEPLAEREGLPGDGVAGRRRFLDCRLELLSIEIGKCAAGRLDDHAIGSVEGDRMPDRCEQHRREAGLRRFHHAKFGHRRVSGRHI
jgi:hypothetical protein